METNKTHQDILDEKQSLQVIKEMIEISRNRLKSDGILFILWGWLLFAVIFARYLLRILITTQEIQSYINKSILALLLLGIMYSGHYMYTRRRVVKTYTGQVLRFLWGGIIFLNLYILLFQLKAHMQIDMLYSQYMLMTALGTFVTGGIIKFRPLIYCSFSFIVFAQTGFFFQNDIHLIFAAVSFLTGLAVPGHLMYSKRNKQ